MLAKNLNSESFALNNVLLNLQKQESSRIQIQDIKQLTLGYRPYTAWKDVLRTNFELLAKTFEQSIHEWFPNITQNNILHFKRMMDTDFVSEQRLYFQIVPKNAIAKRRPIDFVACVSYMMPRGMKIAYQTDQVKKQIKKII